MYAPNILESWIRAGKIHILPSILPKVLNPTLRISLFLHLLSSRCTFSQLFRAAVASDQTVRFLSRYDRSVTNIKESKIWTEIGQFPRAIAFSFFYHINPEFPYQALAVAVKVQEYTLIDRGTWYGVDQ